MCLHTNEEERPLFHGQNDMTDQVAADDGDLLCWQDVVADKACSQDEFFKYLRQWEPATQQNINAIVGEMIRRGIDVNSHDSLSDLTMLHFCCKAGAPGLGDPAKVMPIIHDLISDLIRNGGLVW